VERNSEYGYLLYKKIREDREREAAAYPKFGDCINGKIPQ
jgi:hypothetical protein